MDDEDNGEAEEPLTMVYVVPGGGREVIELDLVILPGFRASTTRGQRQDQGQGQADVIRPWRFVDSAAVTAQGPSSHRPSGLLEFRFPLRFPPARLDFNRF